MRGEKYLYERYDGFTFRRALPLDLATAGGLREFTRALPTTDLADARRMRDALAGALDASWQIVLQAIKDNAAGNYTNDVHEMRLGGVGHVLAYYQGGSDSSEDGVAAHRRRLRRVKGTHGTRVGGGDSTSERLAGAPSSSGSGRGAARAFASGPSEVSTGRSRTLVEGAQRSAQRRWTRGPHEAPVVGTVPVGPGTGRRGTR
ncbi:MAG TPA: DUF6538 domain-containing protein [Gemmatimonadales bacterium]|nr:DUF6538 domain-containing protein [Gemmatimonadales bacterium]